MCYVMKGLSEDKFVLILCAVNIDDWQSHLFEVLDIGTADHNQSVGPH